MDLYPKSMTLLSEAPEPSVDIILVHGIGGNAFSTWNLEHSPRSQVSWIKDTLSERLHCPHARVLSYGYNCEVWSKGKQKAVGSHLIQQHAQSLFRNVVEERDSEKRRETPIFFVAHSLGGLIVQQALQISKSLRSWTMPRCAIHNLTYGLYLDLSPSGAEISWKELLGTIADRTSDDKDVLALRNPDPDHFVANSPTWRELFLYGALLPIAQAPLMFIMGSYKSFLSHDSSQRPKMGKRSMLWPLVRYQICPLSQEVNTADCITWKDVFLDPTPSLFVCASMACVTLYILYCNQHQHHRYQERIMWSGLVVGALIRLYLYKSGALSSLASLALPAIMMISLISSAAFHSILEFYFGRFGIEKAHVLLRAWAKANQLPGGRRKEMQRPRTFDLQNVYEK